MEPPIEFEKVSFDDARKALETNLEKKTLSDGAKGWRGERAAQPLEALLEPTTRWVQDLPGHVRPVALAREFPRIANKLGEIWRRPARCDEYLQSLLVDHRGGRKGFPPAVAMELSNLAAHYAVIHPYRHSVWDNAL